MDISDYARYLRRYPHFDSGSEAGSIEYNYQSRAAPSLITLREMYCLDEVAGEGSAWSRATRLLRWTFDQLFHVADRINPEPCDALNILAHRKKGSLFCIHNSIVLNEALLSLGIQSRLLWCYPYEFDCDCHVVVVAYIDEFDKWVLLDPTFNTYFHGLDGVPLSPLEIRAAYLDGKSPRFRHIEIYKQWVLVMNGVVCETYDHFYELYMAKNSFRFSSPLGDWSGDTGPRILKAFLNPSGQE
jgi:hypothetical protein